METTTDKKLIEKGYQKFKPARPFDNESITDKFQKAFLNKTGKKYFITVSKWKEFTHPATKQKFPPSYEYDIQLYDKENRNPINLTFFAGWECEDVENFAEQLFETGMFEYYEKNS